MKSMMKHHCVLTLFCCFSVMAGLTVLSVAGGQSNKTPQPVQVESLRGSEPISEEPEAPPLKQFPKQRELIDLNYVGQPPLIPHAIRGYEITANTNRCMNCHAAENAGSAGATRISVSHYRDRDGKQLADVSPSRYNCTQCHVVQANARPLVPNTFEPVESLKQP